MNSAQALQAVQSFKRVDTATALADAQKQYGVTDLEKKVQDFRGLTSSLTGAVAAVDPSVTARTQGSLVTEGQRSALVSRERAPVVQQLGTATEGYKTSKEDYESADRRANTSATGRVADNNSQYEQLVHSYEMAYQREENERKAREEAAARAEAQRNADRSYAESVRQFNAQQATTRGSASYGGGSGGGSAPSAQQRSNGGYNFQDAQGRSISARKYAQLTGTNFNTLLRTMAAKGDKGAADVLKHGGSSKAYKALTWN
jgi:hypothetical protein